MKVTGFSIVRNAIKFDYPIVEAIQSVLPLCDEFVVAVGNSDDETLALIRHIDSNKIRIVETIWDDSLRTGGQVLAVETNKALAAISADTDWAFYIQGDEVLHERYIPIVRQAMTHYLDQPDVDGLLFKYLHFYGSYRYIGDSPQWYRHEIRVIRNTGKVTAYRDAQGFRTLDNQKLHVKPVDAYIYHYGWVKPPEVQQKKLTSTQRFWHNDDHLVDSQTTPDPFDYSTIDALAEFKDSHPAVMLPRINAQNWQFDFNIREKKYSLKNRIKIFAERLIGWRMGEYRNYKLLR